MSRADEIFKANCRDILENGVWDTDLSVRPHWEDGAPAHTVKKFGIINRYDLREEFPWLKSRIPTLWTNSYFVSTVGGAPLAQVRKYIERQKEV